MEKVVTALVAQKRSQERVNVFLDGEYAFAVELDVALALKVGQGLTPHEIAQLQDEDAETKVYQQALRFLSFRPRSRWEVTNYLAGKQHPDAHMDAALAQLERRGYVDDHEFARFWVDNRTRFKPRSAAALRYELRQKGVESSVVDGVLADLDEEEAARAALANRLPAWQNLDRETFYKRALGFLSRRGFRYETVRMVCDDGWAQIEEGR